MSFGQRLLSFVVFLLLTVITFGTYPIYFYITTKREEIALLRQIRDRLALLPEIDDKLDRL